MKFSQEFIQKIKDQISLSDILSKYVKLIPAGAMRYKALCPFHNEKTPSFVISDDRKAYHCFGCGAHGDAISFLQEKEHLNFQESVEHLANHLGVAIPKDDFSPEQHKKTQEDFDIIHNFQNFFVSNLSKATHVQEYLTKRNITNDLISHFALGYAPDRKSIDNFVKQNNYKIDQLIELGLYRAGEKNAYFQFSERLIFPIFSHSGKVIAFGGRILGEGQPKYINSPEYKFFKKREILYNFNHAKSAIQKSKQAIICEGYMDVITMHQYGFVNSVAPLGTAFSETHLQILWQYVDEPIICLDGDIAGQKAMQRIADIALSKLKPGKSLNFVILPEGQDPDDILKSHGAKFMKKLIANPVSLAQIFLDRFCHKNINSPEQRAAAMENLRNIAFKIEDKNVQKQYLRFFSDGFYNFFKKRPYKTKAKKDNSALLNTIDNSIIAEELEILLFLLSNPKFLNDDKIEEEFSMMEFQNSNITETQSYLLEHHPDFNLENFALWQQDNCNPEFNQILNKRINLNNKIKLVEEHDPKREWLYLTKLFSLEKLKTDYVTNIKSDDEEKQKLAIVLKHDINVLQLELDNFLMN